MASLSWPWEPLEPEDSLSEGGTSNYIVPSSRDRALPPSESEFAYDPWAEQDRTPTERMYDEMNRDIEPQMETWRAEG